jgi:hypothetical protein
LAVGGESNRGSYRQRRTNRPPAGWEGTFVIGTVDGPPPDTYTRLRRGLRRWLADAQTAGLDDESIIGFVTATLRGSAEEEVA